ncbi:hypothetical protein [Photobacterium lutimaris]|uniref:Uncharacterized protein n=1 Tax=Photobacterium lutimaris TaxID=388278 RepID=A0A2T3ITM9_9GAMM|nr:hypothetical protein [Photobacterium lutimaris]PSU31717.1 hypothetical protein C9I99_21255 [Photobacterium lutimaris]TDR72644.1 hypothetical protein DFP78_113120 [Photobacterium lutimaris]
MIDRLFNKLGYVKKSGINDQLNFSQNIAKRLDEHREDFEFLVSQTELCKHKEWELLVGHLATQDDYFMRLYYMVNRSFPPVKKRTMRYGHVRPRPTQFGACGLPEYCETLEHEC